MADEKIWQLRILNILKTRSPFFYLADAAERRDERYEVWNSCLLLNYWADCLFYVGKWISIHVQKNEFAKLRRKPDPVIEYCFSVLWPMCWASLGFLYVMSRLFFFNSSIPELNSSAAWVEQGFYKNFKPFTVFTDNVERISVDKISPQQFIDRFERPYLPVRNKMLFLQHKLNIFPRLLF